MLVFKKNPNLSREQNKIPLLVWPGYTHSLDLNLIEKFLRVM